MRRNGVTDRRGRAAALVLLAALCAACSDESGDGQGSPDSDGSAETADAVQVSEDCPASTEALSGYPAEGYGAARSLTVCLYRSDGGSPRPVWSTELGADAAEQVVRAVGLGRRTDCRAPAASDVQQVLLRVQAENDFGSEPLWRDYLMKLDDCPSVVDLTQGDLRGGPTTLDVTVRTIAPWAGEGVADQLDPVELPEDLSTALQGSSE